MSEKTPTKLIFNLIAFPLLVTITGGLAVEWLKPREKRDVEGPAKGPVPTAAQASESVSVSTLSTVATTKPSYLGKWHQVDNEDIRLDFLPTGNYLHTYSNGVLRTYPYSVDENNKIKRTEDDVIVEMFLASENELVWHYHQHNRFLPDVDSVLRFRRGEPSHFWRNLGIAAVITLILIMITVNKSS